MYIVVVSVPAIVSSLANVNVAVMGSNAILSTELTTSFQGSTSLTVSYGVMPNCTTNTVLSTTSGGAGDTLTVALTSIISEVTYCYTASVVSGPFTLQITGVFRTGVFVSVCVFQLYRVLLAARIRNAAF